MSPARGCAAALPPLARELALTSVAWGRTVGRIAEDVATMLERGAIDRGAIDGEPSRRSRTAVKWGSIPADPDRRTPSERGTGAIRPGGASIAPPDGGAVMHPLRGPVPSGRITCGGACEQATRSIGLDAFVSAGTETLRQRHAAGVTVELTEAGRGRLRERGSDRVREARAWQREHAWPQDPGRFEREILPRLADVPVRDLVAATGLSGAYCRRIKRGQVVPHPMWWERLEGWADARNRIQLVQGSLLRNASRSRMARRIER